MTNSPVETPTLDTLRKNLRAAVARYNSDDTLKQIIEAEFATHRALVARRAPLSPETAPDAWAVFFNGEVNGNTFPTRRAAADVLAKLNKDWPDDSGLREVVPLYRHPAPVAPARYWRESETVRELRQAVLDSEGEDPLLLAELDALCDAVASCAPAAPREPTEAMVEAGTDALLSRLETLDKGRSLGHSYDWWSLAIGETLRAALSQEGTTNG
jgi:hypothetical protein